jgi:hypothetical protein
MANTYTWDCKTVDTYPTHDSHSDVVYNVHWRLNAESDQQDAEGNNYSASLIALMQTIYQVLYLLQILPMTQLLVGLQQVWVMMKSLI